jgi:hypothetical protein
MPSAPVLAAQPRVPRAPALDVDVHHADRGRRLGVEVLEGRLRAVQVAAQRECVREPAERPPSARVRELAPQHGRLAQPPRRGLHAPLEQTGATEHDGEPALTLEHLRLDGAVVPGSGGRLRLFEAAGLRQGQRSRHEVHAGPRHLHLVPELHAQFEGAVGHADGVRGAARERERRARGQRRLHDDPRGMPYLVEQRLRERECLVRVRREHGMDSALGRQLGTQVGIPDGALGGQGDLLGVLGPPQAPEQVADARLGDLHALLVVARVGLDGAQHLLGFFVLAERVEHPAQQVACLDAGAGVPRGDGEPARQREVERERRLLRCGHQEARVLGVAALETPHPHPQRVLGGELAGVGAFDRVGEQPADALVPTRRQLGA